MKPFAALFILGVLNALQIASAQPTIESIKNCGIDTVVRSIASWKPLPKDEFETTQQWKARWPKYDTAKVYLIEVPTVTTYDADKGVLTVRIQGFLQTNDDDRYVSTRFSMSLSSSQPKIEKSTYKDKRGKKHTYYTHSYNEIVLGGMELPTFVYRGQIGFSYSCFQLRSSEYWSDYYSVVRHDDEETDTRPVELTFRIPMKVEDAKVHHGNVKAVFGLVCKGYGTVVEDAEPMIQDKNATQFVFLEPLRYIAGGAIEFIEFVNKVDAQSVCKLERKILK
ncbi:MAG: hypothetical protein IPF79_09170 [Ignavibacteria bacterium]|nr:hypothetical protein [Ignavibacteria bacterium]